jgi:hypothetical protein
MDRHRRIHRQTDTDIQSDRQQSDLIIFLIFFKIKKVGQNSVLLVTAVRYDNLISKPLQSTSLRSILITFPIYY